MTEHIVGAVRSAMPGWRFVSLPEPFTWARDRHFRAEVEKGGSRRKIVIRRNWRDEGFEVESFLYSCVLPRVPIGTPKLLATFELKTDSSKWMVLEDIGECCVEATCDKDRRTLLSTLGRLHGFCMGRIGAWIDAGPLPRYPKWRHGDWRPTLAQARASGWRDLGDWVLPLLDAVLRRLYTQPPTLVHGDVNLSNVILSKGDVWLVDWEFACIGPAALDLGEALAFNASPGGLDAYRKGFNEVASDPLEADAVRDWADCGLAHSAFHWISYCLERQHEGRPLGEDWRWTHYVPSLDCLRALHRRRGDLLD